MLDPGKPHTHTSNSLEMAIDFHTHPTPQFCCKTFNKTKTKAQKELVPVLAFFCALKLAWNHNTHKGDLVYGWSNSSQTLHHLCLHGRVGSIEQSCPWVLTTLQTRLTRGEMETIIFSTDPLHIEVSHTLIIRSDKMAVEPDLHCNLTLSFVQSKW